MLGLHVTITTEYNTKQYLLATIDAILALMQEEHHIAATHSERNAYQAVIRIKLQYIRQQLIESRGPQETKDISDIPF